MRTLAWFLLACFAVHAAPAPGAPVGSAFTYQGKLLDQALPASGTYDLSFGLFLDPSAPQQAGSTIALEDVPVLDGLFTVELDFGFNAFAGEQLWIQIGVRNGSSTGAHTLLAPRQKLTATPYAVQAQFVAQGSVGALQIDPQQVQARVSGTCAPGAFVVAVGQNGSVTCGADAVGLTQVASADVVDRTIQDVDIAQDALAPSRPTTRKSSGASRPAVRSAPRSAPSMPTARSIARPTTAWTPATRAGAAPVARPDSPKS